jgi:hypothetical protein
MSRRSLPTSTNVDDTSSDFRPASAPNTAHQQRCTLEQHSNRFVMRGSVAYLAIALCSLATLNLQSRLTSRNVAVQQALDDVFEYHTDSRANRSEVTPDEFFHKPPPSSEVDAYFYFSPPDWNADAHLLRLKPTWQCSSSSDATKLVVLHMFRSASSTVRAFFRAYSLACGRSMALVSQCIDLGIEYILPSASSDVWRNGRTSPRVAMECWLNSATNRTGGIIPSSPEGLKDRLTTDFLKENAFDILAGHFPLLGSDAYWFDKEKVQYVVMIRHPLAKFVSQVLFHNKLGDNATVRDYVALVNRTAHNRLSIDFVYESIANYLISPSQKDWVGAAAVEWTPEQRMNLTLSNLFGHKVLVGLVDRMAESVEMLAYVLDTAQEIETLTNYFAASEAHELYPPLIHMNRTRQVVAAIERNVGVAATLQELLQYEMRVYDYARQLHEWQYKWMQEEKRASE